MIQSLKHLSVRDGNAVLTQHYELLTHKDKPSFRGKLIKCSQCLATHRVYSLSFVSKKCPYCSSFVPKKQWFLDQLRL